MTASAGAVAVYVPEEVPVCAPAPADEFDGAFTVLLSLALDLRSGTGVLLDRPPGRRAALLESLGRLLAEPRWMVAGATGSEADQRPRADWIRRAGRQPFKRPATPGRFRVQVESGDPADIQYLCVQPGTTILAARGSHQVGVNRSQRHKGEIWEACVILRLPGR